MSRNESDRRSMITVVLGLVFGTVVVVLVFTNGGMCERYNKRMERQKLMKEYYNSQRKSAR